jgi:zinc protease
VLPKGQDNLIAAADNYKIDSSHYKAPDYGYSKLKYAKAKDNFDRAKIPGNGANPVVKVPNYWKQRSENGLQIIGTQNTELPLVNIVISIPGGHLMEAKDTSKLGLASFFADMMGEDTKNYTAEQLSIELQKLGSSISVSSDRDAINFSVQCLKKNMDMFNPLFTADAFKRTQKQNLEGLRQAKTRPAFVADELAALVGYGPGNILGLSENGTESSLSKITLDDIKYYYDNYMTSQGTRVVVVGDITEQEVMPKLAFLGQLPNKKVDIPAVGPIPSGVDKPRIFLVDIPKAAQTEFRVGYVTGLKYDATGEFYRAGLMNYALGGAFNSRLNLNLREEKGWTYGARSSFDGDKIAGEFGFSSGIKAGATDSALVEVMKELNKYEATGITEEELSFTKSAIGQRDALRYETGMQKAGFVSRILEYDLPSDFVDQQNKILAGIAKADIDALAKKWVRANNMNILLVGDKAKILPGLQKLGYEIIELDADGKTPAKKGF